MLLVNHEGDIYPCHRFPGYDEEGRWRLGSIFEPEKFNHEKRAEFLNYDARKIKADCDHCLAVNICSSTCVAVNWDLHKDLYRPSPVHCRLFRMYFEEGLRVHHVLKTENNAAFMRQYYGGRQGGRSPQRTQRAQRTARAIRKPGTHMVIVGVGTTVVSTQESFPGPLCAYTGFDEAEYTFGAARRRVEQASRLPHSVVRKRFDHAARPSPLATRSWPCAESVVSGRPVVLCEPDDVRAAARAPSFAVGESAMPCCDPACDPCEGCQEPCEIACEGCEEPCQVGCETSCQICANAQEVCCEQCDWPCETTCQGCETCDDPCEAACQPCDTPCETACQPCQMCEPCEACEGLCQPCDSPCQTGCENPCDATCQPCETPCEVSCEAPCDDPCQVSCQACEDPCEGTCQRCDTPCETVCQPCQMCEPCEWYEVPCETCEPATECSAPCDVNCQVCDDPCEVICQPCDLCDQEECCADPADCPPDPAEPPAEPLGGDETESE